MARVSEKTFVEILIFGCRVASQVDGLSKEKGLREQITRLWECVGTTDFAARSSLVQLLCRSTARDPRQGSWSSLDYLPTAPIVSLSCPFIHSHLTPGQKGFGNKKEKSKIWYDFSFEREWRTREKNRGEGSL